MKGFSFNYTVPGYTAADAAINYIGNGYRLSLNVKNLLDKKYYAGGLNNNVIALGDPRQVLLNAAFDF
jgi:iron complex outermembrane recepter protein